MGNSLALPPPRASVLFSQPANLANRFPNGECLDVRNVADDREIHSAIVPEPRRAVNQPSNSYLGGRLREFRLDGLSNIIKTISGTLQLLAPPVPWEIALVIETTLLGDSAHLLNSIAEPCHGGDH